MDFLMIAGLANVLSAAVGYVIGHRLGRPVAGIVWALLLGPLGWLVVLAVGDARSRCAECGKPLAAEHARRCAACGARRGTARGGSAVDPVDAWAEKEALRPENLKPLLRNRKPAEEQR